jgi:iron-sulfur cluster repair protein YtfE (RIC family)
MNIIRFLKDQHDEVNDLLDKIVLNDASEARSLLETMSRALRLHMRIEETILYPAARRCFEGDPRKQLVPESYEEHEFAKQCLAALESTSATADRFVARAKVLRAILREHIVEEEGELFPLLATKLGQSGIEMLGDEVERHMSRLEAESAPRSAKRATTKPRATKSRGAKAAQTRRRRTAVRGAKATARKKTGAGRSTGRHRA